MCVCVFSDFLWPFGIWSEWNVYTHLTIEFQVNNLLAHFIGSYDFFLCCCWKSQFLINVAFYMQHQKKTHKFLYKYTFIDIFIDLSFNGKIKIINYSNFIPFYGFVSQKVSVTVLTPDIYSWNSSCNIFNSNIERERKKHQKIQNLSARNSQSRCKKYFHNENTISLFYFYSMWANCSIFWKFLRSR